MPDLRVGDIVQISPELDFEFGPGSKIRYGDVGVVRDTPTSWNFMVYVDFPLNGGTQTVLNKWLTIVGHVDG